MRSQRCARSPRPLRRLRDVAVTTPSRGRRRPLNRLAIVIAFATLVGVACSSSEPEDPTAFCEALERASSPTGAIALLRIDDEPIRESAMADLDALVATAPSDIAEETTVVVDTYRLVLTELANTAPGARNQVLRDLQERLDAAGPAAEAVEDYGNRICGITFEGPAQPTPTPTPLDIDD